MPRRVQINTLVLGLHYVQPAPRSHHARAPYPQPRYHITALPQLLGQPGTTRGTPGSSILYLEIHIYGGYYRSRSSTAMCYDLSLVIMTSVWCLSAAIALCTSVLTGRTLSARGQPHMCTSEVLHSHLGTRRECPGASESPPVM